MVSSFVMLCRTLDRVLDRKSQLFDWTSWLNLWGVLPYWDLYEGKEMKVSF